MTDPADEYAMWCELHACTVCDGIGEDWDDDGPWTCQHCGGSGIDPSADDYDGPPPI